MRSERLFVYMVIFPLSALLLKFELFPWLSEALRVFSDYLPYKLGAALFPLPFIQFSAEQFRPMPALCTQEIP